MPNPVMPFALKTATALFTVDSVETDFSSHIDTIRFIPSSTSQTWTAIDSYTIGESSPETWEVELGLVQDLEAGGLLRFLMENSGEAATLKVTLKRDAQPIQVAVTLTSAEIGGTSDGNIAQSSITMPATGKPQWLAATPQG